MPMYDAPVMPTTQVTLQAGDNVTIDDSDPTAPVISVALPSPPSLQAGDNVTIDDSDPTAPVISVAIPPVPPGTTRVDVAGHVLGTETSGQVNFTYYAVPSIAQRGVISRFVVTPSDVGAYDLDVKATADGSGESFLHVVGQSGVYDISTPVYFQNNTDDTMYIGIRNTSAISLSFTLTTLRVERLA